MESSNVKLDLVEVSTAELTIAENLSIFYIYLSDAAYLKTNAVVASRKFRCGETPKPSA